MQAEAKDKGMRKVTIKCPETVRCTALYKILCKPEALQFGLLTADTCDLQNRHAAMQYDQQDGRIYHDGELKMLKQKITNVNKQNDNLVAENEVNKGKLIIAEEDLNAAKTRIEELENELAALKTENAQADDPETALGKRPRTDDYDMQVDTMVQAFQNTQITTGDEKDAIIRELTATNKILTQELVAMAKDTANKLVAMAKDTTNKLEEKDAKYDAMVKEKDKRYDTMNTVNESKVERLQVKINVKEETIAEKDNEYRTLQARIKTIVDDATRDARMWRVWCTNALETMRGKWRLTIQKLGAASGYIARRKSPPGTFMPEVENLLDEVRITSQSHLHYAVQQAIAAGVDIDPDAPEVPGYQIPPLPLGN